MCAKLLRLFLTLCNPMDCSPSGASVRGILQAGILEWIAMSFSRGSSQTQGLNLHLLCLLHWQLGSLPPAPPGKPFMGIVKVRVTQLCPTLCDPRDYTVHGILQARILEWVAFPFSRDFSQPRFQTQVSCTASRFFKSWATREVVRKRTLVTNCNQRCML